MTGGQRMRGAERKRKRKRQRDQNHPGGELTPV